jgi:hypothetical protein
LREDPELRKPAESLHTGISFSSPEIDLSLPAGDSAVKQLGDATVKLSPSPAPHRYRRSAGRTDSSTSVATGAFTPTQRSATATSSTSSGDTVTPSHMHSMASSELEGPSRPGHNRANSADDMQLRAGGMDAAKRYRRRSFNGLDGNGIAPNMAAMQVGTIAHPGPQTSITPVVGRSESSGRQGSRPASSHSHDRQGSTGSASSNTSSRPQVRIEQAKQRTILTTAQSRTEAPAPRTYASVAGGSAPKTPEPSRRHAPSPLSHPVSPSEPPSPARPAALSSAAVKQLTAVNDKDKGVKSRLRRAFSFGSAAELRRATAENNISAERAKLRKERYQTDEDAEQAAIIAKQEAAGIGAGIYSGQGGMGSTDNLSIASAASSASMMLRKMGHGVKKGSKSIKGLFRPKSVIGVPAADGPVMTPSVSQVSRVTVEAERQRVNVNADPHDQVRGGTGYPRLERNSIDAGRTAEMVNPSSAMDDPHARRSIVGGDRERAEILSSMKKGILKREFHSSVT